MKNIAQEFIMAAAGFEPAFFYYLFLTVKRAGISKPCKNGTDLSHSDISFFLSNSIINQPINILGTVVPTVADHKVTNGMVR